MYAVYTYIFLALCAKPNSPNTSALQHAVS